MTVENTIRLRDRVSDVISKISKITKTMGSDSEAATSKARRGMDLMTISTDRAGRETDQLKSSADRAKNSVNGLAQVSNNSGSWFKGIGSGIVVLNQAAQLIGSMTQKVKDLATTADDFTMIKARIASMTRTGEDAVQNQKDIAAAAARAGVSYRDFAGFVTKVGSMAKGAFGSTEEVTRFAELLNKASSAEGFSGSGLNDAMTQLTQGLASGTLRGEELNSVLEQATPIAMRVAKSLGMVDKNGFADTGKLRDYASKGLLTAEQVKNGILSQQKDIEDAFNKMPKTFGSIWQVASDKALLGLQPLFDKFSDWLNKAGGAQKITALFAALGKVAMITGNVIMWVVDKLDIVTKFITDYVIPAIIAVGTAILLYNMPFILFAIKYYTVLGTQALIAGLKAAGAWILANIPLVLLAGSIFLLIILWDKLGRIGQIVGLIIVTALLLIQLAAMGVTWPFLLIIGIIALVAIAFVYFGDTAALVCGYIGAIIGMLVAFIYNKFVGIYNFWASIAEFFANMFIDPVYAVQKLFYDLAVQFLKSMQNMVRGAEDFANSFGKNIGDAINVVLKGISWVADALSNLPGFEGLKGSVKLLDTSNINAASDAIGSLINKLEKPVSDKNVVSIKRLDEMSYSDAGEKGFNIGYNAGQTASNAVKEMVDKANKLVNNKNAGENTSYTPPTDIDNIGKVDEVGKIGKDVTISDEDLKYMRDIGRVKFINQFTTLQPKVNATFGDVRETADLNALIKKLAGVMSEAEAAALR